MCWLDGPRLHSSSVFFLYAQPTAICFEDRVRQLKKCISCARRSCITFLHGSVQQSTTTHAMHSQRLNCVRFDARIVIEFYRRQRKSTIDFEFSLHLAPVENDGSILWPLVPWLRVCSLAFDILFALDGMAKWRLGTVYLWDRAASSLKSDSVKSQPAGIYGAVIS